MIWALPLFLFALTLNAFFSGAETGFFRANRLRLVIEAMGGDRIARVLLWLVNQPSLVVATTLVGVNVASDLSSLAVAMAISSLFPDGNVVANVAIPLLVAPMMFICGDLLPKNLFFNAPNRLMRRAAPVLFASAILFAPVTIVLWLISLVLNLFTTDRPADLRMSLARRELGEMLVEGHEAGILRPVQRTLAQTMLAVAGQPIRNFAAPAGRVVRVTTTMSKSDILRIAQRHRRTLLPMEDPQDKRRLVGFVRTVDLFLDDGSAPTPHPLVQLNENEPVLSAIEKLGPGGNVLGHVVATSGKTLGFVTGRELRAALFQTE